MKLNETITECKYNYKGILHSLLNKPVCSDYISRKKPQIESVNRGVTMKKTLHKSTLFIVSLLLLFLPAGCGGAPDASIIESPLSLEKAHVVRVVDGDTAVVRLESGIKEKVRFIGLDTPESTTRHEPFGEEASAFTKSRLEGKTVYLEKDISERDRYGRLLRYIWLEPPAEESEEAVREYLFNAILLLEGYAQVATYPPDVKYIDKYFVGFQAEARNANKGLWGDSPDSANLPVVSQPVTGSQTLVYITETGSKYHRDGCRNLTASKIPISLNEAKTGYEPCKVCSPPR